MPQSLVNNTIHIIFSTKNRKRMILESVEEIKSHSSKWMKTQDPKLENFYWQNGYAAFSVNPNNIDRVVAYIANQKNHHRTKEIQSELIDYFNKYKIEYDERYVWD